MPGSFSLDALGKRVVVQLGVPRWRAADGFPRRMDRAQLDQALQLLRAQLSHSGLNTSLELLASGESQIWVRSFNVYRVHKISRVAGKRDINGY